MTAIVTSAARRRGWRDVVFRVVAGLFAMLLLAMGGVGLLAPWIDLTSYHAPAYHAAIHRWHDAQWGALTAVLIGGSLLALIWRPRAQPLLLQFLSLAAVALAALGAPFDPFVPVLFVLPLALCIATYPAPRELVDAGRARAWSVPLLTLSLAAAALLAPDAWRSLQLQLAGADAHAHYGHWIAVVMLAVTLVLAGLFAATKRPGWQALALLSGAALIYLGLAATILPDQPGSWGAGGGALATIGGWAYVAATAWEARRDRRRAIV